MSRRVLEVVLAVVVGAAVVALAFTAIARRDATGPEADSSAAEPAPPSTTGPPADVDAFVELWRTSQAIDVVVVGQEQTIVVSADGGVDPLTVQGNVTGTFTIRRARLGERRIEQIGTGALVTDSSGQRSCDFIETQFLCTDPTVTPTAEEELSEFTERLIGSDAPYDLFDDGDGCWRAVAVEPSPLVRWGQVSAWCFDADTGALDRSAVWRGDDQVQRFEATEIRTTVTEQDLDPQ